eukprot:486047-Hanusia_phi.AAC.1
MLRHSENAESKVFNIAPVVKLRQSFIIIDKTVLWTILIDDGIIDASWSQVSKSEVIEIVNSVTTDSVSLCIHMERDIKIPIDMTVENDATCT